MKTKEMKRWDPFAWPLARNFDELFRWPGDGGSSEFLPPLDVREEDDGFIVNVELPGMAKKDISVSCENGVVRISGEKKMEEQQTKGNFHRVERRFGRFYRELYLGSDAQPDAAEAQFEDGVLSIRIPKTERAKPKLIELK